VYRKAAAGGKDARQTEIDGVEQLFAAARRGHLAGQEPPKQLEPHHEKEKNGKNSQTFEEIKGQTDHFMHGTTTLSNLYSVS
jgi:hypothetical protein